MQFDPNKHHRRSIRLKGFDYTLPGAYFITIWQRNYYEHIIRNEPEHQAIQDYIRMNPLNWASDQDYPSNIPAFEVTPVKQEENR